MGGGIINVDNLGDIEGVNHELSGECAYDRVIRNWITRADMLYPAELQHLVVLNCRLCTLKFEVTVANDGIPLVGCEAVGTLRANSPTDLRVSQLCQVRGIARDLNEIVIGAAEKKQSVDRSNAYVSPMEEYILRANVQVNRASRAWRGSRAHKGEAAPVEPSPVMVGRVKAEHPNKVRVNKSDTVPGLAQAETNH